MREIKFRVWIDKIKHMLYSNEFDSLYGFLGELSDDSGLMQYTGLKDKNGKEIYEGDVVKEVISFPGFHREQKYTIEFRESGFDCICSGGGRYSIFHKELEVIGNIHENPDLLK